jgi:tripartite-type tricarboxylate transporter receptor subunit TctC
MLLSPRHLLSRFAFLACTLAAPLAPQAVQAQEAFPSRPLRIVVPFAAGGGVDILTRVIAQHLSGSLQQPVTIDNRTGAGGNVGVEAVAKAPADGYTLVMATTGTHTINPGLYKSLPFDAEKDFAPITTVASVPNLLVVNPKVPATNVQELVALARSQPGRLSYASFGNGTGNHLSGVMFTTMAGLDAVHVPYKSATQAVTDLIAGQTAFAFVNTPLALPHVRAGKLRALAVTGGKRSAATPEYPTMNEAGMPGFVLESWYGLMAPAGTPAPVIARLHKEVSAVLAKPEVREFFARQGADIVTASPAEFAAQVRTERARWAEVIKTSGAAVD